MSDSSDANSENGAKNDQTYHSGFDLFPERRNKDFKLGTWQKLFGSASTASKFKCEKNVIHNIEKSPLVKLMMQALASSGCPIDIKRHIVCEQCDTNVTGGYDQEMNQIVICENVCSSKRIVQGVLAHEMIHMFDHCVNKMDLKNIEHLACTEVRAANLTHCSFITAMMHGNASFFDVRKSHAECVKDKAIYSILAVYDISVEKALEVVNKVFTQCYNDLEPVGRRIRRNSQDMFQALEEANYFY